MDNKKYGFLQVTGHGVNSSDFEKFILRRWKYPCKGSYFVI